MKRALLLLALVPALANAAKVTTFPPGPIHLGDWVTIEVDLGVKPQSSNAPEVPTENFRGSLYSGVADEGGLAGQRVVSNDVRRYWKWSPQGQTSVLVLTGYATAPGEIVIGPFRYNDATGRPFNAPAVKVPVGPDLADGTRPAQSLDALTRANRSEVVITAALRKPRVYAGEEVVVEWWAVGDLDKVAVHQLPSNPVRVPGIDRTGFENAIGSRKFDSLNGHIVRKQLQAELHVYTKAPGIYSVPAFRFEGEDLRQERSRLTGPSTVERLRFFRTTAPIQFEVLPRPANAAGPVGTFRMTCKDAWVQRYWPVVIVTVIGSGDLDGAEAPKFTREPEQTVVIIPNEARMFERELRREWTYEVHADEARIPPLTFSYFDPVSGANTEARCEPPTVKRRVEPQNGGKPDAPIFPAAEGMGIAVVQVLGALAIGGALIVLVRTIRG